MVSASPGDGAFLCAETPKSCPSGRVCVDNVCVVPSSDAGIDVETPPTSAFRRIITLSTDNDVALAPILVALSPSRIDYTKTLSDGSDVFFLDDQGARLAHEIEHWDDGGESLIWVLLPSAIAPTTRFEMHYGGGETVVVDGSEVWPEHDFVFHFAGGTADTGAKMVSAENGGGSFEPAIIGDGLTLDGVGDFAARVGSSPIVRATSTITVSVWLRTQSPSGAILEIPGTEGLTRLFLNLVAGAPRFGVRPLDLSMPQQSIDGPAAVLGEWSWYVAVLDMSAGSFEFYRDGVRVVSEVSALGDIETIDEDTGGLSIGRDDFNDNNYFEGSLDELRLSTRAESSAWIALQYASMTDNVLSFGSEETVP